jgi:hypothetical protein
MESRSRGVLDIPLEPVIGLAEGETRWRGMTAVGARRDATKLFYFAPPPLMRVNAAAGLHYRMLTRAAWPMQMPGSKAKPDAGNKE